MLQMFFFGEIFIRDYTKHIIVTLGYYYIIAGLGVTSNSCTVVF